MASNPQASDKQRLWQAARAGHEVIVRQLLSAGVTPSHVDRTTGTPLAAAAGNGHAGVVRLLLDYTYELPLQKQWEEVSLWNAAFGGHEAIVRILLEKGVRPDPKDSSQRTPLSVAAEKGYDGIVETLLDYDADPNSFDNMGQTPLSWAASQNHGAIVRRLLKEDINPDRRDLNGQTPLARAAAKGQLAMVVQLLEKTASRGSTTFGTVNPDAADINGQTPLSWAASVGKLDIVECLLRSAVDPDSKNARGVTPLSRAAEGGYTNVVRRLLLEKDVNPDSVDRSGHTPLSRAARNGKDAVVELLLNRNVKCDLRDEQGRTPLSEAAENGHLPVAKLLLDKGASINSTDAVGKTPLQYASKSESMTKVLLEKEAETMFKDTGIDIRIPPGEYPTSLERHDKTFESFHGLTAGNVDQEEATRDKAAEKEGNETEIARTGSAESYLSTYSHMGDAAIEDATQHLPPKDIAEDQSWDADDRLIHPESYFELLEDQRHTILEQSALKMFGNGSYNLQDRGPHPQTIDIGPTFIHTSVKRMLMSRLNRILINSGMSTRSLVLDLVESRNVLYNAILNLQWLATKKMFDKSFSLLVADPLRPRVVKAQVIHLDSLNSLENRLSGILDNWGRISINDRLPLYTHELLALTEKCQDMLASWGLTCQWYGPGSSRFDQKVQSCIWRATARIIDLAVVSYCGTHTWDFDLFVNQDEDTQPRAFYFKGSRIEQQEAIVCHRQSFACLDGFLKSEAWVFAVDRNEETFQPQPDNNLFLSTDIQTFTDLWGPVWKASRDDKIVQYNTGGGRIVPALLSAQFDLPIQDSELLCHWERGQKIADSFSEFPSNKILLIGASGVLRPHRECQIRLNHVKNRYELMQRGTAASYLEREGIHIEAVAGFSGSGVTVTLPYRRIPTQTLKEAIVEAWENKPGNRNPRVLELWIGVEVSLCTANARKRRLKDVFASPAMRRFMECHCDDFLSTPLGLRFLQCLASPDPAEFRRLYADERQHRSKFAEALRVCFSALSSTGRSLDGNLRGLWVQDLYVEHDVILHPDPYSWIGLLRETISEGYMVVMSEDCLEFDYNPLGNRCRQDIGLRNDTRGFPVLETQLAMIDPSLPLAALLQQESEENKVSSSGRNAHKTWKDVDLSLGELGRLKIIEPLGRADLALLVSWSPHAPEVVSSQLRAMFSSARGRRNRVRHHHQHIDDELEVVTPITVYVKSDRQDQKALAEPLTMRGLNMQGLHVKAKLSTSSEPSPF